MSKKFDVITFHSPCSDGNTGAWCIWKNNPSAKLIPVTHGKTLKEDDYKDKSIAIVDFCFPRKHLLEIVTKAKKVVILDHHKTAERDLQNLSHPNLEVIFDMSRSGAQIAWDYMGMGETRHWFIECVADRDLWKWQIPWSKAVGKATLELGYHSSVQKIDELIENRRYVEFVEMGNYLLAKEEKSVKNSLKSVLFSEMRTKSGTYRVAMSTAYYNRSEVGCRLADKYPVDFAVLYTYDFPRDEWWVSFRSSRTSNIDLSVIAEELPLGGGHAGSAGATIFGANSSPPPEWQDRKGESIYTYFSKPVTAEVFLGNAPSFRP